MGAFGVYLLFLLTGLMAIHSSESFVITVDALAEECFYERVEEPGTTMGVTFEVIDGGFLDIDMFVNDPEGRVLVTKEKESSGRISLVASMAGVYTICFNNEMSTVTPKEIMFAVGIGEKDQPLTQPGDYNSKEAEDIQPEKLEGMIKELKTAITGIKHEQDYMEVRDRIHIRINESTNHSVVIWVGFEFVMVILVTASQVIYIKRFFEIRRVI